MSEVQALEKKRKVYLDMIKVVAIFMVLYNHRSTYTLAASCVGGIKPIFIQALALLCRCGVPLFFMASGVLLLGKNESFGYILKHRVVRILIVMVICAFIKIWGDFSVKNYIDAFFTKLNWYLYAYLDYLFMIPFIRMIAQHTTKELTKVYIILVTLFYSINGCLIYANYYTGLIDFAPIYNTQFASLCWGIIFALTGYFINLYENSNRRQLILFFVFGTALSIVMGVAMVISDISNNNAINIEQLRVHFIYLPSCLIFSLCKILYERVGLFKRDMVNKCIITISSTTFGIFIIETHSELINYINWKLSLSSIANYLGDYSMGCISIIVQFAACFTITYILRCVPFLKKIL